MSSRSTAALRLTFHSLVLTLCLSLYSRAAPTNVTIDDTLGDASTRTVPLYNPPGKWSEGSKCPGCYIRPNTYPGGQVAVEHTFSHTWHDSTYHAMQGEPSSVTIEFTGTAIYIFNLIANVISGTTTTTSLTFTLDGAPQEPFSHIPDPAGRSIMYHVLVFSTTGLANRPHTLVMQTDPSTDSLVLFDEAIYTTENDTTPTTFSTRSATLSYTISNNPGTFTKATLSSESSESSAHPTGSASGAAAGPQSDQSKTVVIGAGVGAAVGAAVGVLAAILTLAAGVYVLRRRGLIVFHPSTWSIRSIRSRRPRSRATPSPADSSSSFVPFVAPATIPRPAPAAPSPLRLRFDPNDMIAPTPITPRDRGEPLFPSSPTESPHPHSPHAYHWNANALVRGPAHRPDVPAPPFSESTDHSVRLMELMDQIRLLESTMRDITGEEKRSEESLPRDDAARFRRLRERVRTLRTQLEHERRLMAEGFPRDEKERV